MTGHGVDRRTLVDGDWLWTCKCGWETRDARDLRTHTRSKGQLTPGDLGADLWKQLGEALEEARREGYEKALGHVQEQMTGELWRDGTRAPTLSRWIDQRRNDNRGEGEKPWLRG